jgi:hypothetical protein
MTFEEGDCDRDVYILGQLNIPQRIEAIRKQVSPSTVKSEV